MRICVQYLPNYFNCKKKQIFGLICNYLCKCVNSTYFVNFSNGDTFTITLINYVYYLDFAFSVGYVSRKLNVSFTLHNIDILMCLR